MTGKPPPGGIRIAPIIGLPELLGKFGVDSEAFLRSRRIDPRLFDDPENLLSYFDVANLLDAAAQESRCESFALLLGQMADERFMGEASAQALRQPSVGAALDVLACYFQSHDRGGHFEVTIAEDVTLRYVIVDPRVRSGAQISDCAAAIGVQLMRGMCGPLWVPDQVELARRPPADSKPFRDCFRCRVDYNAAAASLRFARFWLDAKIQSPEARASGQAPIEADLSVAVGFDERLRLLAHERILHGQDISLKSMALALGLDRKTVHRRLARADLTYRGFIEQERFSLARRLLLDTDMPLRQIAPLLGYAELSVLTRAFTGWAGVSPSEWRKSARDSQPAAPVPSIAVSKLKA